MNEVINYISSLSAGVFYSAVIGLAFIIGGLFFLFRKPSSTISLAEAQEEDLAEDLGSDPKQEPEFLQYLKAHHKLELPYKVLTQNFNSSFDTLLRIEYDDYVEVQLDYCRKQDAPYGGRIFKGSDILFKIGCFDAYENDCLHTWMCSIPKVAESLSDAVEEGYKLDLKLKSRREGLRDKYL